MKDVYRKPALVALTIAAAIGVNARIGASSSAQLNTHPVTAEELAKDIDRISTPRHNDMSRLPTDFVLRILPDGTKVTMITRSEEPIKHGQPDRPDPNSVEQIDINITPKNFKVIDGQSSAYSLDMDRNLATNAWTATASYLQPGSTLSSETFSTVTSSLMENGSCSNGSVTLFANSDQTKFTDGVNVCPSNLTGWQNIASAALGQILGQADWVVEAAAQGDNTPAIETLQIASIEYMQAGPTRAIPSKFLQTF